MTTHSLSTKFETAKPFLYFGSGSNSVSTKLFKSTQQEHLENNRSTISKDGRALGKVVLSTDLVSKHAVELLFADGKSFSVGAVHDQDDVLGAGVVSAPSLSQRLLPANIPHHKMEVLPSHLT